MHLLGFEFSMRKNRQVSDLFAAGPRLQQGQNSGQFSRRRRCGAPSINQPPIDAFLQGVIYPAPPWYSFTCKDFSLTGKFRRWKRNSQQCAFIDRDFSGMFWRKRCLRCCYYTERCHILCQRIYLPTRLRYTIWFEIIYYYICFITFYYLIFESPSFSYLRINLTILKITYSPPLQFAVKKVKTYFIFVSGKSDLDSFEA